jgi:hypothetical protein
VHEVPWWERLFLSLLVCEDKERALKQ